MTRAEPRKLSWAIKQACTCLLLGDPAGYESVCRRLLDRKVDLPDGRSLADAVQICLLARPAQTDMPRITDLAARARNAATGPWSEIDRGLFALRAGRFSEAAEALAATRTARPYDTERTAAGFYLAITLREMGQRTKSVAALVTAELDFLRLPQLSDGDIGPDTDNWMVCQIARREAHHAFGLDAATTQPAR